MNPNAAPFVPRGLAPGPQAQILPPAQLGAPPAAVQAPPPAAAPAAAVIAYANNFDTKHTLPALNSSSAVDVGHTRAPTVKFSTVFRQAYLEGVILAAAVGKGAGNYTHSIACHMIDPANFKLAERTGKGWKAIPCPMFFCKVFYRVTVPPAGGQVVTLQHIETDF